ncbi:MAG TPA: peptide-methionine (S)-S-oxide reductase [Balneolaceae bacterium]|nr:peptide-methionine (S)-S-oxide reductase [Balneolaceae bacterium]
MTMKFLSVFFISILLMHTSMAQQPEKNYEEATFGAGCFWCVEAVFELVNGVEHVESGYSGGSIPNPSYREVSSGRTGYVEVARIIFDPEVVSYKELLEVLWHTHDPTTLNRQGADVGTQYRSVIFYHTEEQKNIAEESLKKTDASGLWDDPIVTTIEPLKNYYVAENYHQDYYNNNPNAGYCSYVIAPKVKKFKKEFKYLLKDQSE